MTTAIPLSALAADEPPPDRGAPREPDHGASPWTPPREALAASGRAPRRIDRRRSSSPKVIGLLFLLFGAWGVLVGGWNLLQGVDAGGLGDQIAMLIRIEYAWGAVAGVAMLVVGGGLLAYHVWARRAAVVFAIISLVVTTVDLGVGLPVLLDAMDQVEAAGERGPLRRTPVIAGMVIAAVLSLPLPVVALLVLSGSRAKAACGG